MKNIFIPLLLSVLIISLVFVCFENVESYFEYMLSDSKADKAKYASISFLVLSSDILLPVPSSIVMYLNGVVLGIYYGFLLSFLCALISASIGYLLGKYSHFGSKKESLEANKLIQRYGNVAIILSRGIPILSESISYTAGFNNVNFKNYLVLNCIGYFPICLIYSFFGNLGQNQNMFLLSFVLSLIFSVMIWFFGKSLILKPLEEAIQ